MNSANNDDNSILPSHHLEEKQWVRKIRDDDDREAFEKLFRSYYNRLISFAYSYVLQKEAAEDIIQSVFLNIWINRSTINPPGSVKHYLFAAVRNESLNQLRHKKVVDDSLDDVIETFHDLKSGSGTEETVPKELREKIDQVINELPPRRRQIFLLNRRSGLTYTEIADYLGISINSVNTQMGRALKTLREAFSGYLGNILAASITKLFF